MLGFFTILAFGIALSDGGWWWAFAISLALIWIGKTGEEKLKSSPDEPTAENTLPKPAWQKGETPIERRSKGLSDASEWVRRLTEICLKYSRNDFYVAGQIPSDMLENALENYPLLHAKDSKVVALIDTTIMGSAHTGMLIHEQGLSWNNPLPPAGSLTWKDLQQKALSVKGSDLRIGSDMVFKTTGSYFSANGAHALLTDIGKLVERWEGSPSNAASEGSTSSPRDAPAEDNRHEPRRPSDTVLVDINQASYDELLSLPGIGAAEAKIIAARRESPPFSDFESLSDFLGLKPHTAERLKNRVVFSGPGGMPEEPIPPNVQASPDVVASPKSPGRRVID